MTKYCVSGLTIGMIAPDWALHDNLKTFLCETGDTDVWCNVIFKRRVNIPEDKARLVVKTSAAAVYESEGFIHSLYGSEMDIPYYTVASRDWSACTMFVDPEYDSADDVDKVLSVRNGLFNDLRSIFIAKLAQNQGLMIHACSIIWKNKGILFSAPAGTGKSTHANLWKELYDTQVLDGDVTACRLVKGAPVVYGLPWCGTSGEFMNHSISLGAIVFLQQAKENSLKKLDFHEAFIRLTSRCFMLPYNAKMTNQFLDIIQEVVKNTDCYLLNCLPDYEAVELVKKCL